MSERQELTESRRGSVYRRGSLDWDNLNCEAFEVSCDRVTFPSSGASAPCSDKQLEKQKHETLRWAEDLQGLRGLQTEQRSRPSPNSVGNGAQG